MQSILEVRTVDSRKKIFEIFLSLIIVPWNRQKQTGDMQIR